MPSITLFNRLGDVTFEWSEDNEAAMLEYIKAKMQKGFVFFLIEKREDTTVLTPTSNLEKIREAKTIRMGEDEDTLLDAGAARLSRVEASGSVEQLGAPVRTAEEVVKKDTVAVARITGG